MSGAEEVAALRPPVGMHLDGVELVVFGGGVLGAALARVATSGGARVTVASRRMRGHAGLWRAYDLKNPMFPSWVPRDARVVLAVGPATSEPPDAAWGPEMGRLVSALARGGRPVSLCGPIGEPTFERLAAQTVEARIVRLAPLFSGEDRVVSWAAGPLREGRSVRVPRGLPDAAPLWAEDAARAVLSGHGDDLTLRGPEVLTVGAMLDVLVARYGGAWRHGWAAAPWTTGERARGRASAQVPDTWDDGRFGARLPLSSWVDRLPGPRRRR